MRRGFVAGLLGATALVNQAAADMYPDASNAKLPDAANYLNANPTAHTYYADAPAYGACVWDGSHDVGPCINAAIAAVQATVTNVGGILYGGGRIVLPAGNFGLATTVLQTAKTGLSIEGAGGQGAFGVCPTQLSWIGAAGGVMVQFGSDATASVIGGGLENLCLDGKSLAGVGVKQLSASWGDYRRVMVTNTTQDGWFQDVSATNTTGSSKNTYLDVYIQQTAVGASAAHGYRIGPGTSANDTWGNKWIGLHIQHRNGDGVHCGNSDTNYGMEMFIQTISGGTGRSLRLKGGAGPVNLSECRENSFRGVFGASLVPGSAPIAEAGTYPSFSNDLYIMAIGSGLPAPVITAGATLACRNQRGAPCGNLDTEAYYQALPADASIATLGQRNMLGLAGTFTPRSTGVVEVEVTGSIAGSGITSSVNHVIGMGTGAAPANGSNATGFPGLINVGATPSFKPNVANAPVPFVLKGRAVGLTLGTPYWIDIGANPFSGVGTVTYSGLTLTAREIR